MWFCVCREEQTTDTAGVVSGVRETFNKQQSVQSEEQSVQNQQGIFLHIFDYIGVTRCKDDDSRLRSL